jgi:hypothetical protein
MLKMLFVWQYRSTTQFKAGPINTAGKRRIWDLGGGPVFCLEAPCEGLPPSYISVAFVQVRPPGYFIHITITTPIISALKNYYIYSFLEVPADILNHFWIQVAVSLVKRPLRRRFGSEMVTHLPIRV